MKRKIAVFLSALMLWSTVAGSVNVAAAEVQENSNTIVETQNDNEDTSIISQDDSGVNDENENSNTQNQISNVEENSTLTDNSNEEQPVINYLAVDQGYLQSPGEQQIVVSFGKGTENIEQPRLSFQKSDGTVTEFAFVKKEAELFLFSHDFSAEEKGVYSAKTFTYVLDGIENSVDLEAIGVNAKFGVDEVYEGYEAGSSDTNTEQEVEASVVDVESGKLVSASTDIASTLSETESVISTESLEGRTVRSRNKVVVLDPGHGGSDGGASANGLVEKNLTLKIAQYCKEELEKYSGVTVYMTRSTDVEVGLEERVQLAKNWGADVFVSIHMNSASPAAEGAEVWYPNSSYNSEIHNNGQKLASEIENELVSLGLANRGVKIRNSENNSKYADGSIADYYSVIRNSKLAGFPGIIVEHAFLTNSGDAEKLKQESFVKKLGVADATGIAKYFGLSKSSASIVEKNDFAGTFSVKIDGKIPDGGCYKIAVWPDKTGQNIDNLWTVINEQSEDDVKIKYNTSDYGSADGIYNVHIYEYDKSGNLIYSKALTCNMSNSSASCKVQDTTGEEKTFKASAEITNVPDTLNRIQFAVWSEQNGQDDLKWYTGIKNGNTWSTDISVGNYKRYGKYNVHAYAVLNDGTNVFLKAMSFNVTKPTAKLTVAKQNSTNGTAEVTVSDIQSKSGINAVLIPVWSQGNQSDLVWYTAKKQSDGTYKITIDMGNHNYNEGTYRVACYIVDGNGIQTGIDSTTCEMKLPNTYLEAKDAAGTEKEFQITLGNASAYGNIRQVRFAVWSVQGGQDDLIWYSAEKKNAGTWTKTVKIKDHRTLGTYNVHAYITLANGSVKTKTTTFNVSKPTAKLTVGEQDKEKGTAEVIVSDIQSKSGINAVLIPVWSQGNQSDLIWYTAKKQSDGTYKITIDMGNHNYNEGTYRIACYIVDGNGIQTGITSSSCQMKAPNVYLEAEDAAGTEKEFQINLTNAGVYGNIRQVQFAVWSVQGGQDDLIWYSAEKKNAGTWTKAVKIKDHKTLGIYNVHAYITLANGKVVTKTTTFNVTKPTGEISISEYNANNGTFYVTVKNIKSASGVEAVLVPVWCAENQNDLVWYRAEKTDGTTYRVNVNIANHKNHEGIYKADVYVKTGNGIQTGIGRSTLEINSTELYAIMGSSNVTVDQMAAYYKKNNLTYDKYTGSLSEYNGILAKGGAANIETYCTLFKQEAEAEGVRVEVAFTQAMLETGFLKFGGDVKPNQYNFAGIGATGGVPGNEFTSVREGIRAQIQHLKCYASDEALNNPCVDPRWGTWLRNKAPYVQWLSKANNPYGIGWATDAGYSDKILNMIKNLKTY